MRKGCGKACPCGAIITLYPIQMFRSLMIVILALALSALPFGMGAMMAAQAGPHHGHGAEVGPGAAHAGHAVHAGHRLPEARQDTVSDRNQDRGSPADGGAHIHFAACGSCMSLPPAAGQPLLVPARQRLPGAPAPAPLHSHDTLPALPPPRA